MREKGIGHISAIVLAVGLSVFTGCTSVEVENRKMNALEREGMGWARMLSSPIDLFGTTYATYDHLYNKSDTGAAGKVFITPFVPILTLPSGTFAMTVDVVTGPYEFLTFSHASSVAYPWESYEYRVASVWNEITPVIFASLATAGAGTAAAADAMNGNGNSGVTSYNNYNAVQSYQPNNSGGGSGVSAADTAAQSRASLDAKIFVLKSKIEREREHLKNAEEAAARPGSTLAASRTVSIERNIIRNYESQLSQLESQRAGL